MGFLAREYGHHPWHPRANGDGVVVDGIEVHEPYLGPVQRAVYGRIFVGEALEALDRLGREGARYDLAIAADILEHFDASDGAVFIDRCLGVAALLVVATPRTFFEQNSEENEFERHRSHWPEHALRGAGARAILHRGESTVALYGDAQTVSEYLETRRTPLRRWLLPSAVEDVLRSRVPRIRRSRDARNFCRMIQPHRLSRSLVLRPQPRLIRRW
jgi:hypothetical protein